MDIKPQVIRGNWRIGWVLDFQTVSSTLQGNGTFTTIRTPMEEAVYRVKYRTDLTLLDDIVARTATFLRTRIITPDLAAIVPVPPSDTTRAWQLVPAIAARRRGT